MLIKTKAIVISSVKYNDKSLIVKCLTREEGVQTYFIQNAFTGKNNKQKKVFFQPLFKHPKKKNSSSMVEFLLTFCCTFKAWVDFADYIRQRLKGLLG